MDWGQGHMRGGWNMGGGCKGRRQPIVGARDAWVVDGTCVVMDIIVVINDGACHCSDACDVLLLPPLLPRARVLSER